MGGHRRFRPSILAKELSEYNVVNVGATGTFVVRKPGPRAKFRAELLRRLPFQTEVVFCEGRDLMRLDTENPFGTGRSHSSAVPFVSILSRHSRVRVSLPISLPPGRDWFVRIIARKKRFLFGVYRRHMKTIRYLGQIDQLVGAPVTTRSWSTIKAIVRILQCPEKGSR